MLLLGWVLSTSRAIQGTVFLRCGISLGVISSTCDLLEQWFLRYVNPSGYYPLVSKTFGSDLRRECIPDKVSITSFYLSRHMRNTAPLAPHTILLMLLPSRLLALWPTIPRLLIPSISKKPISSLPTAIAPRPVPSQL